MDTVAGIYNCSGDIRYATGITSPISCLELSEKLDRLAESKKEFLTGIFTTDTKHESIDGSSQLAGIISGVLYDKTLWIKLMAVLPRFRHMGIGSRAAGLLFQYSITCYGATEVFISVIEKNAIGRRFWRSQKFLEACRFNKELFDGEPPYEVLIMHRRL